MAHGLVMLDGIARLVSNLELRPIMGPTFGEP
jgi:hypothetical protein